MGREHRGDPDGELTYLKVPVPTDPRLEDDEFLRGAEGPKGGHRGHEDGALPADLGEPGLGGFLTEAQRQERE